MTYGCRTRRKGNLRPLAVWWVSKVDQTEVSVLFRPSLGSQVLSGQKLDICRETTRFFNGPTDVKQQAREVRFADRRYDLTRPLTDSNTRGTIPTAKHPVRDTFPTKATNCYGMDTEESCFAPATSRLPLDHLGNCASLAGDAKFSSRTAACFHSAYLGIADDQ